MTDNIVKDPRPDIQEDSFLWLNLLAMVCMEKPDIYNGIRGMRIYGCKITMRDDVKRIAVKIPSDLSDEEKEIVRKPLKDNKIYLKTLFQRVYLGVKNGEKEKV